MRMRILIIAAVLAGGFYYLTSASGSRLSQIFQTRAVSYSEPPRNGPIIAKSAGLSSDEMNNIDIYKRAHNATVNITSTVYRRGWFMQVMPSQNSGSGFFVDDKGHILTNWHVVSGAENRGELIVTTAEGKKLKAEILSKDPTIDLALISVDRSSKQSHLTMGESDNLQVGQKVLAIGNPFGLEGTLTTGIISSLGRTIQDESGRELEGLVQTDAAINFGNSGGPLLDSQGNVIGINTAILGSSGNIGIGFATPINKAKLMLDDFRAGRTYAPPKMGVSVLYLSGGWADALGFPEEGGLLVTRVQRGSAADRAGIKGANRVEVIGGYEIEAGGDLIVEVDGRKCDRPDSISRILSRHRAGDSVEVKLYRGGRLQTLKVTLGAAGEA